MANTLPDNWPIPFDKLDRATGSFLKKGCFQTVGEVRRALGAGLLLIKSDRAKSLREFMPARRYMTALRRVDAQWEEKLRKERVRARSMADRCRRDWLTARRVDEMECRAEHAEFLSWDSSTAAIRAERDSAQAECRRLTEQCRRVSAALIGSMGCDSSVVSPTGTECDRGPINLPHTELWLHA